MFKQSLKLCVPRKICFTNVISAFLHSDAQSSTIASAGMVKQREKWDLLSAVCVERHPVITTDLTEMEVKYQNLLNEIEMENDMKSDHELRIETDRKLAKLIKEGSIEIDLDAVKQTAQDFEDSCLEELKNFQLADRITDADKKNDTKSLDRKLDRNLLLLVEQKIGNHSYWIPPQGIRRDGESMRQAAERVLAEICGADLKVLIYGNAPCGFYKYKYPKQVSDKEVVGAKIFYYQAKYLSGIPSNAEKYQWLDRKEVNDVLPPPVKPNINQFLVSEE